MNFKRRRPKHQRNGCLFCKGYKDERQKGKPEASPISARRILQEAIDDRLRDPHRQDQLDRR